MLTPLKIYNLFQQKVNKNSSTTNTKIPKGKFIVLFNEQKRKWLDDKSKSEENSDYIEDLSSLLEMDVPLKKVNTGKLKDDFELPKNFFKRVSSYSLASSGECKDVIMYNWFVKPKDINVLLPNSNQKPDFEYQETLAIINNNTISIYKDDFTLSECFLTYYREPRDLDIEGYKKIDGSMSTDVQIDLDDISIEQIINLTALEAVRNTESIEQYNLAQSRVIEQKT